MKEEKEFIENQYKNLSESNKQLTNKLLDILNIQNMDKKTIDEKLLKLNTKPDSTTVYNMYCKEILNLLIQF